MPPPATPSTDRVLPTQGKPGPVTKAIRAGIRPGEIGTDALERIGTALLPPEPSSRVLTPRQRQGKRLPRQLAAIIACRTEGMSDQQIADALHIQRQTVRNILAKARKDLGLSDLVDRVEHRAVHTAVDNLIEGLDAGDKDYTLATLKGVGVFRSHQAIKAETEEHVTNELRVVFEMPETGQAVAQVAVGAIVANPRRLIEKPIDAVVVEPAPGG